MSRRFRSSTQRKSKVMAQFMAITQQSNEVAEKILKSHKYNLEPALEYYLGNQRKYPEVAQVSKASLKQLDTLFDRYIDDEKDVSSQLGLSKFFEDVGIELSHRWSLYIMYQLKATQMMRLSRKQFNDYFGKMKAFTKSDIKKTCVRECRSIDNTQKKFKEFYEWLFSHVKENEDKRSIPKDFAINLWGVILSEQKYPLLPDFCKFAQKNEEVKAITLDTWTVVREFLETCKDPKTFENDGAWPVLVDMYLDAAQE